MFHCGVAEMLARVSSRELTEWKAYYMLRAEKERAEEAKQRQQRGGRTSWPLQ